MARQLLAGEGCEFVKMIVGDSRFAVTLCVLVTLLLVNMPSSQLRKEQRACLKFMVQKGQRPCDCLRELRSVYGDQCMSETQVRFWWKRFEGGDINTTTADKPRPGRPRSERTEANIERIRQLVDQDRRRSIRKLSELSGISTFVVLKILKCDLKLKRKSAKFVPRILTEEQKAFRVRLCKENLALWRQKPDEFLTRIVTGDETWISVYEPERKQQSSQWMEAGTPRPQKALRGHGSRGVMFTLFFDAQGSILCEFLEPGTTIDADRYILTLEKLKNAIRKKRPRLWVGGHHGGDFSVKHKFLLHQDNAPSHTAVPTLAKFGEWGIDLLAHPPYSPDLAPCDFSLFPKLKDALRGHRFQNVEDLKTGTLRTINSMHEQVFAQAIADMTIRWEKCVRAKGEYFEGSHIPVETEEVEYVEETDSSSESD